MVQRAVDGPGATSGCRTSCWKPNSPPCPLTPTMTGSASTTPSPPTTPPSATTARPSPTASTNSPSAPPSRPPTTPTPSPPGANIAHWTGQCGDAAGALRLSRELLPDQERVLGPDHPDTLATRGNIAPGPASAVTRRARCACPGSCCPTWSGCSARTTPTPSPPGQHRALDRRCGDAAGALRLSRELLPDQERVLGPDHPDTLTTRDNIASWTGECGDAAGALRLSRELLPDQERVLGPDHPDTLTTRNNIARLDRRVRGRGGGAAPVPGAAARPGAGPRPGPPRHPHHPEQHRALDRPVR